MTIIANTLEEYDQSPDSKVLDDQGVETRKPHPLDIIDGGDILFNLDMSLKEVALKAAPIGLLETTGSTASELRRVSVDYFIRVPVAPVSGQDLDIDDGLSYAVTFRTLGNIWREYGEYDQKAESIMNTYIQAYRVYLEELIVGTVGAGAETYIRFSDNGVDWHTSFVQGDTYISFKRIDTDTWTASILFVGGAGADGVDGQSCSDTNFIALQDTPTDYTGMAGKIAVVKADESGIEFAEGGTGGGAATFAGLTDTPISLAAGKWVKVNAAGDAIELVDAPSGGAATLAVESHLQYDDTATGTLELDAETNDIFYIYPNGDIVLNFKQFADGGTVSGWWGKTYTFMLVSIGTHVITFDSNESIFGDHSIGLGSASSGTSITVTMLKMFYSGTGWYVVSRNEILDANG